MGYDSKASRAALLWMLLAAALTSRSFAQPANGLLREVFEGIGGVSVSDLTGASAFPNSPSSSGYVTEFFEAPTDVLENYGQRLRGYVVPPVSGNYTFWIASDDGGELWLSTDDSPATRRRIAAVNSWTGSREWTREANQQSEPVSLEAGRIYYVEALMKEGGGGDNLAVRWLRPDGVDEAPIPGSRLLPWGVALKAPSVLRNPRNTEAVEGLTARFDVQLDPLGPARIQWRKNGRPIPGATNVLLEYAPVSLEDQNARFSVALTNQYGSAESGDGILTVIPDTTAPRLVHAENRDARSIRLVFSESVSESSAQTPGHYRVDGGVTVSSAVLEPGGLGVRLTVTPMEFGKTYELTVNQVTDRAATPNPIAPNSIIRFTAVEYTPTDIGAPSSAGSVVRLGSGKFNVTGGGAGTGQTSDQFLFAAEERTGDFDLRTRIEGVTITDAFLRAGLMARERLEPGSRFAAIFASSAQLGCFFESRASIGARAAQASIRGGYPVNYPQTWLRLRRTGSVFTGFASLDGNLWTPLGSVTLPSAPATLFFGLAVASLDPASATQAQFRDVGPVVEPTEGPYVPDREPPGPFVRSSGLVLSEIMYHPREDGTGRNLEFVELYNAGSIFEDLSGFRIVGEIGYTFPEGTRLEAGQTVVIAGNPEDVRSAYGITNVLGPFSDRLPNEGGLIELRARQGDTLFKVEYETRHPWPVSPDGTGHSLTLSNPSYGPSDPRAWSASQRVGGSPGGPEILGRSALSSLRINEVLAHTDDPVLDFVELLNAGPSELDLSGCVLTDDIQTNRFVFPAGTRLAPGRHLALDQNQLGYRLKAAGETLYLVNPQGDRVLDCVRYDAQENGVSFGRQPDGASEFRRLSQPTPGAANATWKQEQIVISELMYNPISGDDNDEYLELHNRSTAPVDLAGWRFTSGIDFRFPAGVTIPAGGDLVVARNPAHLRAIFPNLTAANTVGPYSGTLSDRGERVALSKPDEIQSTNEAGAITVSRIYIDVAEVTYVDGGAWGTWSDGGGSSLELTDVNSDPRQPSNWADSDESTKGEWASVSFTGRLDNGNGAFPPRQLQITLQGGGEALVDDVEVVVAGTTANLVGNPGFETGVGSTANGWTFQGNHADSFIQNSGAASGSRCLHVKTEGRGDTGFNRIRTPLLAGLEDGSSATFRARVRWVRGWPELLFRIRGNWVEMPVSLPVPAALGTPGQPNSRRVDNAGPSISEVTHFPVLPAPNEPVRVTARVADPDGITTVNLLARLDGNSTTVSVAMRDDGTAGDSIPGDGIYTGVLGGRGGGALVVFRVEATDGAATPASARFPADAPEHQGMIRWGDPVPFGTLGHYHMWNTSATEAARNATSALNNRYRDLTFVYGNSRVIYGAGFKDKGSPFHGGGGDWFVSMPSDQPLLGASDLALTSTGNTGSDETNLREQVCFSIARGIGASYLHRRYVRLYRNGAPFRDIMEDSEEPNGDYAERFYDEGERPDLYKIEDWFEFADNGTDFSNVDATLQRFTTPPETRGAPLKAARYRWSWRKRAVEKSSNNYTNLLNLVEAVNTEGNTYSARVLATIDVDQWMRTFAFQRIVGNWDSYGMGRGKNMYAYKRDGITWKLFSWDVDFALDAGGNGPTDGLWGAGDPVINRMFDDFAIRRRLWQAYLDAANGPLQPEKVADQVLSRFEVLRNNGVPTADGSGARNYLAVRRKTILDAYAAADVPALEITSNGGRDITTSGSTVNLTGRAPLALTFLTVNGVPYPVTWTDYTSWRLSVPLTQATNALVLGGTDRHGNPIPGFSDAIQVVTTGLLPRAEDFVVINEIQYDSSEPNASYLELLNTSTTTPFDISGFRLEGTGYTFPLGSILPAAGFLVLAKDRAAFSAAYGSAVSVFGEFPGSLDNDGERLALVRPDPAGGTNEVTISEVRYGNRYPWPTNAAGLGPSLQLVDPLQDIRRPANWLATSTNQPGRTTPGLGNSVRTTLEPFPDLWLNEVLVVNTSGPVDNAGEREPFIELHNSGTNSVDLSGYFLSNDPSQPEQWAFPPGSTVAPGGFLVVWADGQTGQTSPGALHTSFRLAPSNAMVALLRRQGSPAAPAVMDFLEYGMITPNRSYGSYPDGSPTGRRYFDFVTAGAPNDPAVPDLRVTINEFMAANASAVADPVDNDFEDWFELFNAGSAPVDLAGFYLTDNLTNWNQFRIPPGYVVPPGGFLLVWADGEAGQNATRNGDLHTPFRLAAAREQIGLFDPNGRMVDGFEFRDQLDNTAVGRFPDGAAGSLIALDTPTPRGPNVIAGGNIPPVLNPIGSRSIAELETLRFTVSASDPDPGQSLRFSLEAGAPPGAAIDPVSGEFIWTPSEPQGPGNYRITVRVTDNGTPARFTTGQVNISVTEANRAPLLEPIAARSINEGSILAFTASASDPDLPKQELSYSLVDPPTGVSIDPATGDVRWIPSESQGPGVYSLVIRVTDDATPSLQDEQTVEITVNEVDSPPVIQQLAPVTVVEGRSLVVTNRVTDSDTPLSALRFSLPGNPPSGVRLDPITGVLTWDTTEEDGPSSHQILIRVTQPGPNPLSDQYALGVTVEEDNQPPSLAPMPDITVEEGDTVSSTAFASDTDLPPQRLTYSLAPDSPAGAEVDSTTGAFRWKTDADAGASTNTIVLRVSDDGSDSRSSSLSFRVVTVPKLRVAISEVMFQPAAPNGDYVELMNPSAKTDWDLGGLQLRGTNLTFSFPAGFILKAGASICVVRDVAAFRAAYGAVPSIAGAWNGVLGKSGDLLRLTRPSGNGAPDLILDELRFEASDPWPAASRGGGAALQAVDVRQDNSRVGNWSTAASYRGPRSLVEMTNTWRYHQSGPLDPSWKSSEFPDNGWSSGPALLCVETSPLPAPKNTPLTLGQNTYYFRTSFILPSVPTGARLLLNTILDDGAVFYVNGTEVFRQNMDPTAVVDFNTAATLVDNAVLTGPFELPASALVSGTNVLAVEVHQVNAGSSDIVFGCSLELEAGEVPAFTPGAPNNVAMDLPEFPRVWISELLSRNVRGITDASGQQEPWIEIENRGDSPVSLEGWSLSDATEDLARWTFPPGATLPPRSHTVVFADGQPGQSTPSEWHAGFRLKATGGMVLLSRTQPGGTAVVDYLRYGPLAEDQSAVPDPEGAAGSSRPAEPTPGAPTAPNRPPQIGPIAEVQTRAGEPLQFFISASDPDSGQSLIFLLQSGPPGLTISSGGRVDWTPANGVSGRHPVKVQVRDDGIPMGISEATFTIVVGGTPLAPLGIQSQSGSVELMLPTLSGVSYRIESSEGLGTREWRTFVELNGTGSVVRVPVPNSPASGERYFRAFTQ